MCDIRIASEAAFFACAYGRIGASPDGGMTYFLPRVIGPAAAAELMLEDPNLTAADALERGLVSQVVARRRAAARRRRRRRPSSPPSRPTTMRMVKRLVWQSLDNSLADHLQLERHGIAEQHGHRGPARRRPRVLRRRAADVRGPLSGPRRPSESRVCASYQSRGGNPCEEAMHDRSAALAVLAVAAFALAACGGDDDSTRPRPPRRRPGDRDLGAGSRRRRHRQLRGRPSGSSPSPRPSLRAKAGNDTIDFDNPSSTAHDVVIEDAAGNEVAETDVDHRLDDDRPRPTSKPGTYTFYCSVPGHREGGMEGTLTVK